MASVGIVGGLGVGATVHYYEKITAACKALGVIPDLAIVHADVDKGQGFVREGRLDALADYLAAFIERLGRAGAAAAVLPAVTPHICIAELTPRIKLPLINIVDAIGAELRKRQLRRVALFGTTFTMQGSLWGQLSGVEIVKPQADEIAFVGRAYQRILDTHAGNDEVTAEISRRHNDLNVLCLSADMLSPRTVERMVEVWISTPFEGGRHERRVEKIHQLEQFKP